MSSSKSQRLHSEMVDVLTCIICFNPYDLESRLPKVFSCQHTVCLSCANELCQQQDDGDVFPCPTCRRPVPIPAQGAAGLQTNLDVSNMVEITQKTADTSVATPDCPNHPSKPMSNMCMTCKVGLCTRCFTSSSLPNHTGHQILEIDDAFHVAKHNCEALVQRANETSLSLGKLAQESQDTSSLIQSFATAMLKAQKSRNVSVFELIENLSTSLDQTAASRTEKCFDGVSVLEGGELTDGNCTESVYQYALKSLSYGLAEFDLDQEMPFASNTVVCTKLAAVAVLIDLLRLKLYRRETHHMNISMVLTHLWKLTDESEPCCRRVVLLGGAILLVLSFETFKDIPDITYRALCVFCQLANVRSHHAQLLFPSAVEMLSYCVQNFTDSQQRIPALACDAISSFLCNNDAKWPQGCVSRDEISELVMTKCEQFTLNAARTLGCSSFSLYVSFLSQQVSDAAKYWPVWLINALTRNEPSKYCPMLVRDGGVAVLKQQGHAHRFVKKLSKQILERISRHGL